MVIDESFQTSVSRWGTHSAKWDLLARPLGVDALSLSVAEMEFLTCPQVAEAVTDAARHGVFGYTEIFDDYRMSVRNWQASRHRWDVDPNTVVFFPRIVQLVSSLVNHCFDQLPTVATFMPAYSPILEVVRRSGCKVIEIGLEQNATGWVIPASKLGSAIEQADIFLLCSPHNPTGRVWQVSELAALAELALRHHTLVVSDDVHADFTREGHEYVPLARASASLSNSGLLVTALSPGKTFNMAGLEASAIVVPDPELRKRLEEAKRIVGLYNPNYFAVPATIAAWSDGAAWVDQLNDMIDRNVETAEEIFEKCLPDARFHRPEGTYLIWVDLAQYIAGPHDLEGWQQRARVAVSPGIDFGQDYGTWARFNVALPPSDLVTALIRFSQSM